MFLILVQEHQEQQLPNLMLNIQILQYLNATALAVFFHILGIMVEPDQLNNIKQTKLDQK